MSSILATGSTTPAFISEGINADGGLDIIGNDDMPNIIKIVDNDASHPGGDFIIGGSLGDIIDSSGGDDIIIAGAGDDFIAGGEGSDIIEGGEGSDIIRGGAGADYIKGGEGMDIFDLQGDDFASGEIDRYLDFEGSHTDALRISGVSEAVTYDSDSGEVKVGDDTVAYIGKDLDIDVTKLDDDTYDLF